MSATARTNWFWSDWLGDPAVRRLTPAERGVWIDCLALMAAASPVGYLCDDRGKQLTHEEVARVVNATPIEVAELLAAVLEKGVASRDRTGRLYNRRMVRDASLSAKRRLAGKDGGEATRLKWLTLQSSPQQTAWQLPQPRASPPYQVSKIKTTSVPVEREPSQPAGSLATAPCDGALTRPPDTEQVEGKQADFRGKSPAELSRSELEASFASRKAKEAEKAQRRAAQCTET